MTNLVYKDPFRGLFSLPSLSEDVEDYSALQRGLRVKETKGNLLIEAVVAGVPDNNVEVSIEDGILTIKAQSQEVKDEDEYKSSSYQYYYTVALSGGQWDKADAEVEHGIVKISIPKEESQKARKIAVRSKKK
ncbi:Hsp20/alpha crystallin family protein [Candidatus Woesebacteria bacterium]|nr:MAG: Hsp20/alpha crystallin family protein [Candidatus Woesebacteria bacterium]